MGNYIPFDGKNYNLNEREVIDIQPILWKKNSKMSTQKKATSRLAFGGKIRMATFYLHNQYLPVTQKSF